MKVDLAIIGAGGAGLAVVRALDRLVTAGEVDRVPRIALFDPAPGRVHRTWCYWDDGDPALEGLGAIATAQWSAVAFTGPDGHTDTVPLHPLRYTMLTSQSVVAEAEKAIERLGVIVVAEAVDTVEQSADAVLVRSASGEVEASWVLDSRPGSAPREPEGAWHQRFSGHVLRTTSDVFDPGTPTLMDFTAPQPGLLAGTPAGGLAFGYVLPTSRRDALVEYVVFSRAAWTRSQLDAGLAAYLAGRWGAALEGVETLGTEGGAIPMTTAARPRRLSDRMFVIGTAGGATRPSTGYTFATLHRQADAIARALLAGGAPVPPRPYPVRHRWYDAVLLRALDEGLVDGPEVYAALFRRQPARRVLRFLDGHSSWTDELAIMRSLPMGAMVRAALSWR